VILVEIGALDQLTLDQVEVVALSQPRSDRVLQLEEVHRSLASRLDVEQRELMGEACDLEHALDRRRPARDHESLALLGRFALGGEDHMKAG
jgi:hypothetical protein